jgi:hypothetical protein
MGRLRTMSRHHRHRSHRLNAPPYGAYRRPVLANVDVGRLIAWCNNKGDPAIWESVARAVPLFELTGEEKTISIGEVSSRFLEASPCPERVLKSYANRIRPSEWVGSRAGIMERNANALDVFTKHQNPVIATLATRMIADAKTSIRSEHDRERRQDEANELQFE